MSHLKSKHDEHPLKNYKIVLEYDGTPYCGWQVQAKGQSIQGVLQEALKKFTGWPFRESCHGSSPFRNSVSDRDKYFNLLACPRSRFVKIGAVAEDAVRGERR